MDSVNDVIRKTEIIHWPHPNLPPHDPFRYQSTDGFDNPRCTNAHRADFAAQALRAFQQACAMVEDIDTAAADLICDLLHLLHANHHDPLPVLQFGIQDFLCEAGEILPIREIRS
jgi:hypothetical protein